MDSGIVQVSEDILCAFEAAWSWIEVFRGVQQSLKSYQTSMVGK